MHCAGHILQLLISRALKQPQITKTPGAARFLVEHFKEKSELVSSELKAPNRYRPQSANFSEMSLRRREAFTCLAETASDCNTV